jgi:large subunit ribosomal protein L9
MAMEILLMADVAGLGAQGDVVKVADGYARNYLIPKSIGAPVTEATRRRLAKLQKDREKTRESELRAAREQAARLEKVSCTLSVKTGEDEKMYGSVTVTDIVDALKQQGIEIDKHKILLEQPIRELGVFDIGVKLHPDVKASVKLWIVEE